MRCAMPRAPCSFSNFHQKRAAGGSPQVTKRPPVEAHELARCLLIGTGRRCPVSAMNNEIDSDEDSYEGLSKGAARRRVDAYHEALRERAAMRELEQPFVLDVRSWPPPRY